MLHTIRGREQRTGWILILPALLLLLLVFAYPIGRAFWLSLFTRNLGTKLEPVFSGLDNYVRMVGDGRFWQSFWTTSLFTLVSVVLELLLGMRIAFALVTTGILTFIFAWNEFIFALTFMTREELKTIPVAAAQLGGASAFEIPYGPIAAATVLGTLPLVLLVLFFQRQIVQGLTAGAVKG